MSAEKHHIQYVPEPPAIGTAFVGWSAFGTLLLLLLAIGGLYGVYHAVVPARNLPAPQSFPKPRVDTTENDELRRIQESQIRKLQSWQWADGQHSLIQVPIERAMQLLEKKGASAYEPLLPTTAISSPTAAAERATMQPDKPSAAAPQGGGSPSSAGSAK